MHAFHPRWPADIVEYEPPVPWVRRYRRAEDVIAWAEYEPLTFCQPSGEVCPDYWLLADFRHERWDRRLEVTEADAAAFVRLRKGLARHGVRLLDAIVIADDRPRWWSLNELTTGTTEWEFPANPRSHARPRRPKGRAA